MALNQLEFGNEKINMEHFDVVILVQNYLQASDILIKRHEAKLRIIAPDTVGVWADQYMVEEAFDNYFTNALNHLDGNKNIDITISVSDGKARVSVFNTGEKIPEEAIPYLWDKFYKVDKARTREYGGSGVGLSIVKAIMESLNQYHSTTNVLFYFFCIPFEKLFFFLQTRKLPLFLILLILYYHIRQIYLQHLIFLPNCFL